MKVRIIYRNYKPLHKIYESLVTDAPQGVEYVVPPVNDKLTKYKFIYRKYRHSPTIKKALKVVNKVQFSGGVGEDVDLIHIINMVPDKKQLNKPYILEAEHASALTAFNEDKTMIEATEDLIMDENCKAVVCTSKSSEKTFKWLLGNKFDRVRKKFHVVYPTIKKPELGQPDNEIITDKDKLNLIFVGNDSYRKGLNELLFALQELNKDYKDKVNLYVVSNDADEVVEKYNLENVFLYPANFSKNDVINKIYLPADLYLLPTKMDTYGMSVIDSLASGTPVLATKQFALPEIIDDGVDGFLVDLHNPVLDEQLYRNEKDRKRINTPNLEDDLAESIKTKLEEIIKNPEQLKSMGEKARAKFDRGEFSVDYRNDHMLKIYEDALKK